MKKAIVIGSTGMVGTQLIQLLLESKEYSEIVSLVRRSSGITHPKLTEYTVDFDKPETWSNLVSGDVLFSTLGTTIARAKTKENQYKVDFTYQYTVAEIAAKNGVTRYVLVSSAGANSKSGTFYMSMKGKLDEAVQSLPFEVISILRPGLLHGDRVEKRFGEIFAYKILKVISKIGFLNKYKPIDAQQVAMAMINAAKSKESNSYTLDELFELAK